MADLFSLRDVEEKDRAFIDALTYAEGMDFVPTLQDIRVAVNDDDDVVGFLRLAFDGDGCAYVNPVVVHALWRGYGVGKALMQDACDAHGEVRLVSRGTSIPFYQAIGFEECSWDLIAPGVSEDCDSCSWREECGPLPMRKPKPGDS